MSKSRFFTLIIVLNTIFSIPLFSQNDKNDQDNSQDLARVGILPFEDRTGSPNYGYLSESLSDAINVSMQKNFTYSQISYKEIKKAVFTAQQEIIKKQGSLKAIDDPKKNDEWKEVIKDVSDKKNLNADVLIYGSYTFDEASNEIIFSVSFYLGMIKMEKSLDDIRNPVDNTIFTATEKVAQSIVEEIDAMVEKASKIKHMGEKTEKAEVAETTEEEPVDAEEKKPQEKRVITRQVVEEGIDIFNWKYKKMAISGIVGLGGATDSLTSYTNVPAILYIRYWPVTGLQLSLTLRVDDFFDDYNQQEVTTGLGTSFMGGYALPLGQFLLFAEAGPSYQYMITPASTTYELWGLEASAGAELLVTGGYSIGLKVDGRYLIDFIQGNNLLSGNLYILLSLSF